MRKKLKEIGNKERHKFTGEFVRYGYKIDYGHDKPTILFKNIKDENGKLITDHLWFNLGKTLISLGELYEGEVIEFYGRVTDYKKGYFGDDMLKQIEHPISRDYKIQYPTKYKIVKSILKDNERRNKLPKDNYEIIKLILLWNEDFYSKRDKEELKRRNGLILI